MSKNKKERFDFNVMQEKEKERINKLKDNTNLNSKINPTALRLKQILYDGYVGTEEEFKGILIIAAEAHDPRYYDEAGKDEDVYNGFYVKKVVQTGNVEYNTNGKRIMDNLSVIYNAINEFDKTNVIKTDSILNEEIDYNHLKTIAYINLKKVGGAGKLNDPDTKAEDGCTFHKWVGYHKKGLAIQINDISPKYIVLCSGPVQRAFNRFLLSEIKGSPKIFHSYHPSVWNKKPEEFVNNIKLWE